MVTIEDERKTLEYQETMNLDIENIGSTSQKIWRSIYEVIHDDYFKGVKFFPAQLLDHRLKKRTSKHTKRSQSIFKRWLCNKGSMHKWLVYEE